jgi:prepilin-type N-terminal cleavage/methylation domain-containing protein
VNRDRARLDHPDMQIGKGSDTKKVFKRIGAIVKKAKSEKGFTLVELIVTVTIIGILAAVVTTGVSGAASTAQTKANQAVYGSVQAGMDTYAASTPAAAGVPTVAGPGAAAAGYYGADGSTAVATLAGDLQVDFTSGTNSFNTFFRMNNASATFKCIVTSAATFTLKACHN